jgi:hypothetical protein
MKSRMMRADECEEVTEGKGIMYRVLVGKFEGKT